MLLLCFVIALYTIISNSRLYSISIVLLPVIVVSLLIFIFLQTLYFKKLIIGCSRHDSFQSWSSDFGHSACSSFSRNLGGRYCKRYFYAGLFVAVGNIFVFILLLTNQYNIISDYMIHLGLTTYIDYTDSFFVRPSGYFFDVHSQYFLPLISLTLLKGYDLVKSKPKNCF